MNTKMILDVMQRANKLGAQNIEVTGYAEPQLATQDPTIILIVRAPEETSASEKYWYDR